LEELQAVFETELLFVESGGDNLAGEPFSVKDMMVDRNDTDDSQLF
jgi:Ni2+-binding GTPase involved in maturation of urease and hydrogenase